MGCMCRQVLRARSNLKITLPKQIGISQEGNRMRQEYFHAVDVMIRLLITMPCIYAVFSITDTGTYYRKFSVKAILLAGGLFFGFLASWVICYIADAFAVSEAVLLFLSIGVAVIWFVIAGKNIAKKKNYLLAGAFLIYIIGLFYLVIASRIGRNIPWIRVDFSEVIEQLFSDRGPERIMHSLQNILMFVPLGCFISEISEKKTKVLKGLAAGIILSVCIESIQLLYSLGECDIMDIVANGAGCAAGELLWKQSRLFAGKSGSASH